MAPSSMGPGIVVFARPVPGPGIVAAGWWAAGAAVTPAPFVMVAVAAPEVERTHFSSATITSCRSVKEGLHPAFSPPSALVGATAKTRF